MNGEAAFLVVCGNKAPEEYDTTYVETQLSGLSGEQGIAIQMDDPLPLSLLRLGGSVRPIPDHHRQPTSVKVYTWDRPSDTIDLLGTYVSQSEAADDLRLRPPIGTYFPPKPGPSVVWWRSQVGTGKEETHFLSQCLTPGTESDIRQALGEHLESGAEPKSGWGPDLSRLATVSRAGLV